MRPSISVKRFPWGLATVAAAFVFILLYQFGMRWSDFTKLEPPLVVVLREIEKPDQYECWIGVRDVRHVDRAASYIAPLCLEEDHDFRMQSRGDVELPERIYYVYVSPEPWSQHEWNVDTDEPNYTYRCHDGEMTIVAQREGFYRDENNKLMPEGWRPPRPEPAPWYEGVIKTATGLVVLFVLMAVIALAGRRGRKKPATTDPQGSSNHQAKQDPRK